MYHSGRIRKDVLRQVIGHKKKDIALWEDVGKASAVSFFRTDDIRNLFLSGTYYLESLLIEIVGKPAYFEQYLFDTHFAHPGWSGFVSAIDDNPKTLLDSKKITFSEWASFELLMELDVLQVSLGKGWKTLSEHAKEPTLGLV